MELEALRSRLAAAGQGHLLNFWAELGAAERRALTQELRGLDCEELGYCFRRATAGAGGGEKADGRMEALPRAVLGSATRDEDRLPEWEREGDLSKETRVLFEDERKGPLASSQIP